MKRFCFVLAISLLAFNKLIGQNLVPNPSFEDIDSCPPFMDQLHLARPWYSPTANTPDLFNVCSPPTQFGVHIPKNVIGYQHARTGNAYAGFGTGGFTAGNPEGREYVSTRLSDTLVQGKKYCAEFYISLGDSCAWAIDKIGVFFSNDSTIDMSNSYHINETPQIETDSGYVYNDTASWIKVFGSFTAQGGERYFTIGNFHADSTTTTDSLPAGTWYTAYYYIDDVSVMLCDDTLSAPPDYDSISLTPSPSNGLVYLRGNFPVDTRLKVYDVIGREVGTISVDCGNCEKTLFLPFAPGVYFYRVEVGEVILKSGNLVISE